VRRNCGAPGIDQITIAEVDHPNDQLTN